MKTCAALALPLVLSTAAAAAEGGLYSGRWPVTAQLPPNFGNTACLTLVDNGSAGSPHSGPVSAAGDLTGGLSGTFQVVNNMLVVNLQTGSDNGEVVFVSFIAHARNGSVSSGVFNEPGYLAAASLEFGKKGGC